MERVPYRDEIPRERVQKNLQKIVKGNDSGFNGRVRKTASGLSLFPLINLVMDFDGQPVLETLTARHLPLCPELTEHLQQHKLRAGVIVRPGKSLNSEELVAKLGEEVKNGALRLTCFLLIQNSKVPSLPRNFVPWRSRKACMPAVWSGSHIADGKNWQTPFRRRY